MNTSLKIVTIALAIFPIAAFANSVSGSTDVGASVGPIGVEGGTSGAARTGNATGASTRTDSVYNNRMGARLNNDARIDVNRPNAAVDTRSNSNVRDLNDNEQRQRDFDNRVQADRHNGTSQVGVGIDASGGSNIGTPVGGHSSTSSSPDNR